jgi:hypothetical protein
VDAAIKAADTGRRGAAGAGGAAAGGGSGGGGGGAASKGGGDDSLAAKATPCRTAAVAVVGAHGYAPDLPARLTQAQHHIRVPAPSGGVPVALGFLCLWLDGGGGRHASSSSSSSTNSSDGGGETAVMVHLVGLYKVKSVDP